METSVNMVSKTDKETIIELAKKYKVESIILFGSATEKDDAEDIDIGVRGVEPGKFFKLYGELFRKLSKPVDLVDLSKKSLFNSLVEDNGIVIYG